MTKLAIIAAAGLAASTASATNFGGGSTGAIADNTPAGTSYTLNVASSGIIVSMDALNLDFEHTWAGDLIVTLTHGATSVVIWDRLGVPASTFGNGDNFLGAYSFVDGGPALPETATGLDIPAGTYGTANSLAAFVGQDVNGLWTLNISDNASADTGTVHGWSIDATVPAPGAAALFGLGGLAAARRRR